MNMNWKKGKAATDKHWKCILCGDFIPEGYYYLRPHRRKGPNWKSQIVKGHDARFNDYPPCFHIDCFETLGSWFGSIPPAFDNIYDNDGNRLPLQDPKAHWPDGKPV